MAKAEFTLVLGGARSGKSTFASGLARRKGARVLFVATATALDEEMKKRIAKHRSERPTWWQTLEAATDLSRGVSRFLDSVDVVLVDCVTLMVFNAMVSIAGNRLDEGVIDEDFVRESVRLDLERLVGICRDARVNLIMVSNEVGLGVVPPYPLGRSYRDVLGFANQILARQADKVYFLFSGLPVELRALMAQLDKGDD